MMVTKIELKKLLCSPFVVVLFFVFVIIQWMTIYNEVGESHANQEYITMHRIVTKYGVKHPEVSKIKEPLVSESLSEESTEKTQEYYYKDYVNQYGDLYKNLDMQKILSNKMTLTRYTPKGFMKEFIHNNYDKLQNRVDKIRSVKRGESGFYPGKDFKVHSFLFGTLGKQLIWEISIAAILCILYLMDYERIQKTRYIVLSTKLGKGVMKQKVKAAIWGALLFSIFLMVVSYTIFFSYIPFGEFWNVPIESSLVAEPRFFNMFYPYVTFWNLTWGQYLLLTIVVDLCIVLLVSVLTVAVQLLIRNSYISFCFIVILLFLMYILAYNHTGYFIDVIIELINPICLYITCGLWFIENDVTLAFAGSEFFNLLASGALIFIFVIIGRRKYIMSDVA